MWVGSNDKRNVKKNLNIVLKKFKFEEKIFLPKQFHSNKFYYLNHNSKLNRVKCDAVITDKKNSNWSVNSRLFINLYDPINEIISVVHAGWRGALGKAL